MRNQLLHRMDLTWRFSCGSEEDHFNRFYGSQKDRLSRIIEGAPYLVATYYIPGELVARFDIEVIYMERLAGFAAANKIIGNLGAESIGFQHPVCMCSYQRLFDCLLQNGILPPPAGFLVSSYPCDDAWTYCWSASKRYQVPFHFLDVGSRSNEDTINDLAAQLENLHRELKHCYRSVKTREEICELSLNFMRQKQEIDKLRRRYPGIQDSLEIFKLFTIYNDRGSETGSKVLESMKDALIRKIPNYKTPTVPKILWVGVIPLFRLSFITELMKRYRCIIVYEDLFDYADEALVPECYFSGMAKNLVSSLFFTTAGRIDSLIECVETYGADGIIHFSQHHCRFLPPMVPAIHKALHSSNVPFIEIKGDVVEPECFDVNRCWEKLDVFFEQLAWRFTGVNNDQTDEEYCSTGVG